MVNLAIFDQYLAIAPNWHKTWAVDVSDNRRMSWSTVVITAVVGWKDDSQWCIVDKLSLCLCQRQTTETAEHLSKKWRHHLTSYVVSLTQCWLHACR